MRTRCALRTADTATWDRGKAGPTRPGGWSQALPVLTSNTVTLRQMRPRDAASLLSMLASDDVARFISPPPATTEGFERFIAWAHREQTRGTYACFAVVPAGSDVAVGIFQVRALDAGFGIAEWGFAMGSAYWGTGLFAESARLVLDFAFDVVGVHRLEARAAVSNGRGNGALMKMGAVYEGILRRSFTRHGKAYNQILWSILAEDWRLQRLQQRLRTVMQGINRRFAEFTAEVPGRPPAPGSLTSSPVVFRPPAFVSR